MKTIEMLLEELKKTKNIRLYLENNKNEFFTEPPARVLQMMLKNSKISIAEIAKESAIGDYVYKVFSGKRKPGRNVLISLALTMNSSYEELQSLLDVAGYALLSPKSRRDSILLYGIFNRKSVVEVDDILDKENMETLSKEK